MATSFRIQEKKSNYYKLIVRCMERRGQPHKRGVLKERNDQPSAVGSPLKDLKASS
jgi:hypothetical protein